MVINNFIDTNSQRCTREYMTGPGTARTHTQDNPRGQEIPARLKIACVIEKTRDSSKAPEKIWAEKVSWQGVIAS